MVVRLCPILYLIPFIECRKKIDRDGRIYRELKLLFRIARRSINNIITLLLSLKK